MSNSDEANVEACSSTSQTLNIQTFDDGTTLTAADLEGSSGVLLVDPTGNVLGDLSMTLDANQMPIFITHVAKASEASKMPGESVIELSEVHGSRKRKREEEEEEESASYIKSWLSEFQEQLNGRLKVLDEKASALDVHCQFLYHKTQALATQIDKLTKTNNSLAAGKTNRSGTLIVGIPPAGYSPENDFPIVTNFCTNLSSSFQLITQNTEDYPDGSWLGNPEDPEMRVRCHLDAKDLDKLTQSVMSGEKMALVLLDYLFDRETQACSNISGNSKHGKKQLDPLKIYGIKCHVMYHFGVDENAWQRIKLNLDSKCRTAFRRKLKGMPLTMKAFREVKKSRGTGSGGTSDSYALSLGQSSSAQGQAYPEEEDVLSRVPSLVEEEDEEEEEEEEEGQEQGAARVAGSRVFAGVDRNYSKYQPPRILSKSVCSLLEKKALILEEEEDESSAVLSLMEAEDGEDQLGGDTIPITIHQAEGTTFSLPLSQLYGEPQVLFTSSTSQLIQTENGDFQLLQATPEQLAQIQQGHPIQILTSAGEEMDLSEQEPC